MEEVRVGLQTLAVCGLKGAKFFWFRFTGIDRERFVDEQVPDFFSALPGVERFVLGVANPAELRIGLRRLGAVAIPDDLENAFALVDLLAQHPAQIPRLGPEDILPDRLVAEEREGVRGQLPTAPELTADG
jgi:hypothetical protein